MLIADEKGAAEASGFCPFHLVMPRTVDPNEPPCDEPFHELYSLHSQGSYKHFDQEVRR